MKEEEQRQKEKKQLRNKEKKGRRKKERDRERVYEVEDKHAKCHTNETLEFNLELQIKYNVNSVEFVWAIQSSFYL